MTNDNTERSANSGRLTAQQAVVTPLMTKELAGPAREGGPDDHGGRNASTTKPAKFVVLLLKDRGSPVLVPAR